jgi:hypothetical protein
MCGLRFYHPIRNSPYFTNVTNFSSFYYYKLFSFVITQFLYNYAGSYKDVRRNGSTARSVLNLGIRMW